MNDKLRLGWGTDFEEVGKRMKFDIHFWMFNVWIDDWEKGNDDVILVGMTMEEKL